MIERYLLIFLAILLAGSLGAFFLFVPILPTFLTVVLLSGLAAMFYLGFRLGRQQPALPEEHLASDAEEWSLSEDVR